MTDYILNKIKNKVLSSTISVDGFGLISATFAISGKDAVTVTGNTIDELNKSFDNYLENEQFESVKTEKKVVEKKDKTATKKQSEPVKANEKPEVKEQVIEDVIEDVKEDVKEEPIEVQKPKEAEKPKEKVEEKKKPVIEDDDEFNF